MQVAAVGDVQSAQRFHGLGGGGALGGVARRRPPPHHPAAAVDAHPQPPQTHSQKRISAAGASQPDVTPPFHDQRPGQRAATAAQVKHVQIMTLYLVTISIKICYKNRRFTQIPYTCYLVFLSSTFIVLS